MKTVLNLSLVLAVALLAVHEMDAMTHAEWALLPILSGLSDAVGRDVFILLHIPLYIGLFWALFFAAWKAIAARVYCGVLVIHAIVHFLMSGHELYSFSAPIETITVYGAAIAGLIYLGLSVRVASE